MRAARRQVVGLAWLLGWLTAAGSGRAEDALAAFDQANRLYEQGQFTNAATAYQNLIRAGHDSATLYFNLGNAWFKAGQSGRAIAAYRQAEQLAPRDPYVRFNLQFVRKQVTGSDSPAGSVSNRFLAALTLNEWTGLAVAGWWVWLGLLALREHRPALRTALRGYTATAGVLACLLGACLAAAWHARSGARAAVVVVPSAVVRRGPLEESQVAYQLRDGSEVTVVDQKTGAEQEVWLQVQDESRRLGWLKRNQVVLLGENKKS
jgi:tetratricopeptide (TPR) repeat protein